jgi:hypothetical protein
MAAESRHARTRRARMAIFTWADCVWKDSSFMARSFTPGRCTAVGSSAFDALSHFQSATS